MADATPQHFNCRDQRTESWRERAIVAADLLASLPVAARTDARLADIGCGDGKLATALRERGLGIGYRGYDLHPQSPDVLPFDVRDQPLPAGHDVAVLLGVIEYLPELPAVLSRLALQVPMLLVSHVVRDGGHYDPPRLRELGWRNHLTIAECEALLTEAGFTVAARRETSDRRTVLFLCVRAGVVGA